MNINELCQKSVDKPDTFTSKPISIENVLESLDKSSDYSEGLKDFIYSASAIMVIVDSRTPIELVDRVILDCGSKLKYIVSSSLRSHSIMAKYKDKELVIDKNDIAQFNYYGTTKAKVPILFHKSIMECNAIINLASVRYDGQLGYTGGAANVVMALSAKRTIDKLATVCVDSISVFRVDNCANNNTLNPLVKAIRECVMTASARVSWFGINYVLDTDGNIVDVSSGDIFVSQISLMERMIKNYSVNLTKKYSGIIFETNTKYIEELIYQIDNASNALRDGCRMLVKADNVGNFLSPMVMKYINMHSLSDVLDAVNYEGGRDALLALHARTLGSKFHIAVDAPMQNNEIIKKCGWNTIDTSLYAEFMQNCTDIINLTDVIEYAIRKCDK